MEVLKIEFSKKNDYILELEGENSSLKSCELFFLQLKKTKKNSKQ